jgi:NTE family protein
MRNGWPRIGLALGSGSARGWAHFGVIQALDEFGIPVHCVAGTSIGALVGAIFASGTTASVIDLIPKLDWRRIASFFDVVFPRSGLIDGKRLSDFIRLYVRETNIEDLPIPFRALATDLATGQEVVLSEGDIIEAVRASMSFPGILTPVRCGGVILVDGGMINPVPVSTVREMGAEIVIAVDLNHDIVEKKGFGGRSQGSHSKRRTFSWPHRLGEKWKRLAALNERLALIELPEMLTQRRRKTREDLPSIFEVLFSSISIMETQITQSSLKANPPDLLLQPKLGHIRLLEFQRAREGIAAGYEEALEKVGEWLETCHHG